MKHYKTLQNIKNKLIDLACDDKLPLNLNNLDMTLFEDCFNDEKMVGGFSLEDVDIYSKQEDYDLTNEEIQEVFTLMEKRLNCEQGLNWSVIDCHINEVIKRRVKPV